MRHARTAQPTSASAAGRAVKQAAAAALRARSRGRAARRRDAHRAPVRRTSRAGGHASISGIAKVSRSIARCRSCGQPVSRTRCQLGQSSAWALGAGRSPGGWRALARARRRPRRRPDAARSRACSGSLGGGRRSKRRFSRDRPRSGKRRSAQALRGGADARSPKALALLGEAGDRGVASQPGAGLSDENSARFATPAGGPRATSPAAGAAGLKNRPRVRSARHGGTVTLLFGL
jgi:hypothetical protein